MASVNVFVGAGNLCSDPELKFIPSGQAVCNLRLAINRKWKDKSGVDKDEVCFVTVVAWGKVAESCGEYLKKGASVLVEGRLQSREWENEQGQKRTVLEICADRVQFLDKKEKSKDNEIQFN